MILLSHPTANSTARHDALALRRAGVLGEFWTCSAERHTPHPLPITLASLSESATVVSAPLARDTWDSATARDRRTAPRRRRLRSLNAACRSLDHTVSTRLASEEFNGVYAYEDGAEESFRAAGRRGLLRIYGVNTAHWKATRTICMEESVLEPEWAATLDLPQMPARTHTRTDAELHQADLVVVGSTFMLSTLDQVSALPATVAVLPPGLPLRPNFSPVTAPRSTPKGKLRVLFVGPLAQRKGLSYLFRACRKFRGDVSLTLIGPRPHVSCPALERELREVRWRPLCSPTEILNEMAAHDVLLAPSLFEGFDPIMLDAMATGLPVIATPHTAAPDLLDHGVEGFIVPVRSTDDIVAKLDLLRRDPERRVAMAVNARRRAQQHTWESYERALAASVATALARR